MDLVKRVSAAVSGPVGVGTSGPSAQEAHAPAAHAGSAVLPPQPLSMSLLCGASRPYPAPEIADCPVAGPPTVPLTRACVCSRLFGEGQQSSRSTNNSPSLNADHSPAVLAGPLSVPSLCHKSLEGPSPSCLLPFAEHCSRFFVLFSSSAFCPGASFFPSKWEINSNKRLPAEGFHHLHLK